MPKRSADPFKLAASPSSHDAVQSHQMPFDWSSTCVSLFFAPFSHFFPLSPPSHSLSSPVLLPLSTDSKTPHRLQELSPSPQFIVNGATRLDVRQGKLSKYAAPVYTTSKTVCFDSAPKEDYIKVSVRQRRLSAMKDLKLFRVSKSTHCSEEAKSSGMDLLLTKPADLKWQLLLSAKKRWT